MKERTLGVEVFGRDPDYDTNSDPVVRTTASEIRKRLAQTYDNPGNHHDVRIRLDAGSYQAKFEFLHPEGKPDVETFRPAEMTIALADAKPATVELDHVSRPVASTASLLKWILIAALVISAWPITLVIRHYGTTHTKDYLVWKPLLDSAQTLMLCSMDAVVNGSGSADPNTSIIDAEYAQKITTWLTLHGRQANFRGASAVSLRDLRQGPVVLIGAFNPWSLTLLNNLRYSVHATGETHEAWIQDARDPANRQWKINTEHTDLDYAIITRYFDQETGNWVLELGGLRPYGTQAAGDLLTDPSFIPLLPDGLAAQGNFQIVLKASVINGSAGRPQVLAFYTW
jgi:hypothetical protein